MEHIQRTWQEAHGTVKDMYKVSWKVGKWLGTKGVIIIFPAMKCGIEIQKLNTFSHTNTF
jgi:hypothetical protein